MDSEHSMLAAAGTAAATGVRVFTATSSQGLVYGFEMLYAIAGLRLPLVLVNVSRALAHPITLEPDHNDVLSARDTGFLQFHAETSQEVLDSILMGRYRLAEHPSVLLPVIVNLDGFYLSFTRETVDLPALEEVNDFLPPFTPAFPALSGRESEPHPGRRGGARSKLVHLLQTSDCVARPIITRWSSTPKIAGEFADRFGRHYGMIEEFMLDDADYVIVMTNSFAAMGKAAVKRLREQGERIRTGAPAYDQATFHTGKFSVFFARTARESPWWIKTSRWAREAFFLARSPVRFMG